MFNGIWAAMLATFSPGVSHYSVVPISAHYAEDCRKHRDCPAGVRYDKRWESWVMKEDWELGSLRYQTISQAIERVVHDVSWSKGKDDLAATLLATFQMESGFRRDVHTGVGKAAVGDGGRSFCLGQIQRMNLKRIGLTPEEVIGETFENTYNCAYAAAWVFRMQDRHCARGDKRKAFSCYASGSANKAVGLGKRRLALYNRYLKLLKGYKKWA